MYSAVVYTCADVWLSVVQVWRWRGLSV